MLAWNRSKQARFVTARMLASVFLDDSRELHKERASTAETTHCFRCGRKFNCHWDLKRSRNRYSQTICSHKKGVSALQLQRNLGLHTYRAAWFLAHRIRLAMKQDPVASQLKGIVEVDETYVGGKPRKGKRDEAAT